jgi:hypothetical protein
VVTYSWYRFADQPAILNADMTDAEREALQKRVELLHKNWTKDKEYLPPPTVGTLADLDPAVLVTPPKGLEFGYVPIVTRQERAGVADDLRFPSDEPMGEPGADARGTCRRSRWSVLPIGRADGGTEEIEAVCISRWRDCPICVTPPSARPMGSQDRRLRKQGPTKHPTPPSARPMGSQDHRLGEQPGNGVESHCLAGRQRRGWLRACRDVRQSLTEGYVFHALNCEVGRRPAKRRACTNRRVFEQAHAHLRCVLDRLESPIPTFSVSVAPSQ